MAADYLEKITVNLPVDQAGFNHRLVSLLAKLGETSSHSLELTLSNQYQYPRITADFQSPRPAPCVEFLVSGGEAVLLNLDNITGEEKKSPHVYGYVEIDTVTHRLSEAGVELIGIDHLGVNLPWFAAGAHPRIGHLRESLKAQCLYHRYPTGEPWDFILPGTPEEIIGVQPVDYGVIRRPKFELVSFEKTSMPLIQIDLGVDGKYENYAALFPEALSDPDFRNIWIYLRNPHAVDVCLVINEFSERDWSGFFKGNRL
jgi:hypothetical protein